MKKIKVLEKINFAKETINPYENREGLVYVRVSDKKQETQGFGLQSQEGRCIKELNYLNIPHVRTFPDSFTGEGDFMRRPAMSALLGYIKAHPHKKFVVIFDDIKRFARDRDFHFQLRRTFKALDVVLKCLNYNFDESPEGVFTETIFAAQAQLEREQNKRQVIQKMKSRLDLGYWAFVSKRGYTRHKNIDKGNICVPNEEGLSVLKPALEGFANGTFVRKIDACKFLIEKGFWKKRTATKYLENLDIILRDPFYAGFIEFPPWEVSRRIGKHKGIISPETFERIQKRLRKEDTGQRMRNDRSLDFPLRGLLVCADCNNHLTGAWTKGRSKRYAYYVCQNKPCLSYGKIMKKKDIEDKFDEILKENTLKDEVVPEVRGVFDRVWNEEIENYKKAKISAIQNTTAREAKITEWANLIVEAKTDVMKRIYENQIENTAKEIEEIKNNSGKELDMQIPYRTALDKSMELLKNPYSIWNNFDPVEQHRVFYFIFDTKLPYSRNVGYRTSDLPCAVRIFEEFATSKSDTVDIKRKILNRLKAYLIRFWDYYQASPALQEALKIRCKLDSLETK